MWHQAGEENACRVEIIQYWNVVLIMKASNDILVGPEDKILNISYVNTTSQTLQNITFLSYPQQPKQYDTYDCNNVINTTLTYTINCTMVHTVDKCSYQTLNMHTIL